MEYGPPYSFLGSLLRQCLHFTSSHHSVTTEINMMVQEEQITL